MSQQFIWGLVGGHSSKLVATSVAGKLSRYNRYSSNDTTSFGIAAFNLATPFLLTAVSRNSSFVSVLQAARVSRPSSVTPVWLRERVVSSGRDATSLRPSSSTAVLSRFRYFNFLSLATCSIPALPTGVFQSV